MLIIRFVVSFRAAKVVILIEICKQKAKKMHLTAIIGLSE